MPVPQPKTSGVKPRSWFMVRAAKPTFTRLRKAATYIARISGTNRQAARRRTASASMKVFSIIPQPFVLSLSQDGADYKRCPRRQETRYHPIDLERYSVDPPVASQFE